MNTTDLDSSGSRQLWRLERLMDIVFGLILWRIITLLPSPDLAMSQFDSVAEMLVSEWAEFVVPMLAILIVTVYWLQNNSIFSKLRATDSIHTGISIFQLFFLFLYLYAVALGIEAGSAADTRIFESSAATLVGGASYIGWWYAAGRGGLLSKNVTTEEAAKTAESNLAEPLTALLTIPAAFIGSYAWEISWFMYPLLKKWLDRRKPRN